MKIRYAERNITSWEFDANEDLGTKPKIWVRDPESAERWLLKDATFSAPANRPMYRKGDDWSERVATAIAVCLRLPVAHTELTIRQSGSGLLLGVMSRSFLKESEPRDALETLVPGNEILAKRVGPKQAGYTLEAIGRALENVARPAGISHEFSAWDVFAGYLLLDALIGNTDRHEQNWGVIARDKIPLQLAPSFDHASSLGFSFDDETRVARLTTRDRGYQPESWAARARSKFEGRPNLVAVALEARRMMSFGLQDHWLNRCANIDRLVEPIRLIPEHRMSQPARDFAERVVRHNQERLLRGAHR